MGFFPKKVDKNEVHFKNIKELEPLIQHELEYWWKEAIKHMHWEDVVPKKLEERKKGFWKAMYNPLRVKCFAFSDVGTVAEWLKNKRDENIRTLKQKMSQFGEKLHGSRRINQ